MKISLNNLTGVLLLGAGAFLPLYSKATTLNFDDLPGSSFLVLEVIQNGYAGLNWSNFRIKDTSTFLPGYISGYRTGAVSPSVDIFNAFQLPAEFSSSAPFTFNSIYLTAAWYDDLIVEITGFLGDQQVASKTVKLNPSTPQLFTFNWTNIDKVRFVSSGGTSALLGGDGTQFVADNLVINEAVLAPLPLPYTFSGFQPPINDFPVINIGKAGRTYPVKWQLKDKDGNFVSTLTAVKSVSLASVLCGTFGAASADAIEIETTGETMLRYDTETNQFIYNWKTPRNPLCYMLFITLDTNQVLTAKFNLTK